MSADFESSRIAPAPTYVIGPSNWWRPVDWRELWQHRELLYFLAWRDVKIRYRQTTLGVAWALLQPLTTMAIFSILFGRIAGLEEGTGGTPYSVFVFVGLLPWLFFAGSVANASSTLAGSANLMAKVYFPRLLIPLSSMGAGLVDLALSMAVLVALIIWHGGAVTGRWLLVPVLLAGVVILTAGAGTLLSALSVTYRDFRHVIPFVLQIGMFVTPVIYPPTIVSPGWRGWLALNPMTGFVEALRWAFLGTPVDGRTLGFSFGSSGLLFLVGTLYFRRAERRFADIM